MNISNLGLTMNIIKKTVATTIIMASMLMSFSAAAAGFVITGAIQYLSTTDQQIPGAPTEGGSSLRFTTASVPMPQTKGTCFTGSSGFLVIHVRDNIVGERMYTTLLAAQLSGHQVQVTIDDTFQNSVGHCYAQRVRIEL
jgi:hypothetical protein